MIENNQAIVLWKRCLNFIKDNVNATAYKTWFEPVVPLKFEDKALTIGVPSPFFYEYLEEKYVGLLRTFYYITTLFHIIEIGQGTNRSCSRFRLFSFPSIHKKYHSSVHAWNYGWSSNGLHADYVVLCHIRHNE